ncbi:hypothetical protein QUF80_02510 [Desulfococcaceae bacterium HSG8]|nr:hypothetical protein [Desulfococcaceae bacterium HSG8]
MKSCFVKMFFVLMVFTFLPANALSEKRWIWGRIKGNTSGEVVTLVLEHISSPKNAYRLDTSTNKFGQYAFSDEGQGSPSNYKLIISIGNTIVKQVSLKGIRVGGRVPDIVLSLSY